MLVLVFATTVTIDEDEVTVLGVATGATTAAEVVLEVVVVVLFAADKSCPVPQGMAVAFAAAPGWLAFVGGV